MPIERPASTTTKSSKTKTSAFKPPRPFSKPPTETPNPSKKRRASSPPTPEIEAPPEEDEEHHHHQQEDRDVATIIMESSQDAPPTLPPKLLTKLLHEHFTDERTRINRDANKVVAKYMETFVKEALARAALEREESARGGGATDGFLEVEDLEKLAPQLLLDF
ncbi:MAG: hypothetical protein M1835_006772 [Candelina submexicana]|nr:MAG: hypothetical protein M1835_006772 [Candelina submexicana]